MYTVAIIQARMGSTRLPGKVLRPIAGRPMIDHVVERARHIPGVDQVGVATSMSTAEAPLVTHLNANDIPYVQGSEEDVLARYVRAGEAFEAERVIRITSDCPLLDPAVAGRVLQAFEASECDYASNTLKRTWPRGLDTEVLSMKVLRDAHRRAETKADREHVTRYVWRHPQTYQIQHVTQETDHSSHRWTVDEEDDLELVRRIVETLQGQNPDSNESPDNDSEKKERFRYETVLALLEQHPEWATINAHIEQKKC